MSSVGANDGRITHRRSEMIELLSSTAVPEVLSGVGTGVFEKCLGSHANISTKILSLASKPVPRNSL